MEVIGHQLVTVQDDFKQRDRFDENLLEGGESPSL